MYKLSPNASFLEGIGRTADFDDNLQQFNYSESNEEADARALYSDFCKVGDMFVNFVEEHYKHVEKT